jgi:hypothetical protein
MKKVKDMDKQIDVVGIGCQRCASSFLHDCLNQHPEILKPPRGLHFFSKFSDKGYEWYLSNLPDKEEKKILLEFSVSYTYPEYAKQSAQKLFGLLPNIKLFATIRNPVKRAFSEYLRSIRNCEIPTHLKFEEAIDQYPFILERGRYKNVLGPYFDLFPREKIFVLIFEDLKLLGHNKYLKPLFRFLKVQEDLEIYVRSPSGESGRQLKMPKLQSFLLEAKQRMDQSAKAINTEKVWKNIKQRFIAPYQAIRSFNTVPAQMNTTTIEYLKSFYEDDINWVAEKINRDLEEWK